MWDWHSWCCSLPTTRQKQPNQSPLLTAPPQNDAVRPNCISFSAAAARMLTSWLNRRRRRYLFLIICSPFLIPLLCATCPIICAVELCFLVSRRRRKAAAEVGGGRRRSGGGGGEVGLLQRYLEDQLALVAGPPCGCGDDDESFGEEAGVDVECFDSARPLLQ
ncbi:transmembrane protein [Perilla frutescens var. frutescens]|nr:transmembrane protein [Perilla frutescens var. frutescens]